MKRLVTYSVCALCCCVPCQNYRTTFRVGGSAVICKNQDKLRLYQVEDELELFDADRASELERLKREKERTI